jgi:hypothetical protein
MDQVKVNRWNKNLQAEYRHKKHQRPVHPAKL